MKKLPIDLGQGNLRFTTKGKLIALSFVKNGHGKTALDVGCREGVRKMFRKPTSYQSFFNGIEEMTISHA
ncbi:MAG TPA: hypothetical protein VKA34_01995 [Balneolales bacterium]|nr:hypothetical protein [Balneolales bacterium]